MKSSLLVFLILVGSPWTVDGQTKAGAAAPFTLTWSAGKCVACKTAADLGRIQFISRNEAWAVGGHFPTTGQGSGDYVVVHTTDRGRSWKELYQTAQHAGDLDGPPAFSFFDAAHGWISCWNPAQEPNMIHTADGGKHWDDLSHQFLQKVRFFDDSRGYGAEVNKFLRTTDGGRSWTETEIPHLRFIDRLVFLTPDLGWIAGTDGKEILVFRTVNGGHDWEESRTTAPTELANVRDLFFLDRARGWLITWHSNDSGTYLFSTVDGGKNWAPEPDLSFQGRGKWAGVVRFVSETNGFVFEDDRGNRHSLIYTTDSGRHWTPRILPHSVYGCQVFEGELLCSSGRWSSGIGVLRLHPQ